jgi:hypothetical protein
MDTIMATADTEEAREMAVAAQGMAKAAELLGQRFSLIATNVPYLVGGKQSDKIRDFAGHMLRDWIRTWRPFS